MRIAAWPLLGTVNPKGKPKVAIAAVAIVTTPFPPDRTVPG
jgi:hypothetical protein